MKYFFLTSTIFVGYALASLVPSFCKKFHYMTPIWVCIVLVGGSALWLKNQFDQISFTLLFMCFSLSFASLISKK
jgi:hypothetical protein